MLNLINEARVDQGLTLLVLGDNPAAQLHAESSLENCFSSHWGLDGLKPYMRYSLNGGYQSNTENVSGDDYCIEEADGYPPIASVEQEIRDAVAGWMENPDQRRNIFDPSFKKVSVGLAWDRYNFKAVQHFEGDYVEYHQLPIIEHGALAVSGTAKSGVRFETDQDLAVQIYFDPPPHALTRGQVARTDCYRGGTSVASIRPSASGGAADEYLTSHRPCPDPYDVPVDDPPPRSVAEAQEIARTVHRASQATERLSIKGQWITARWWNVDGASFEVTVDVDDLLLQYGEGVYTIVVWAPLGGRQIPISRYSIFHGITPPEMRPEVPTPTSTPAPASTPVPTSTPTRVSTPTPMPTVMPEPASTPVPVGTPDTSESSSEPAPNLRHLEEKRYMLQFINQERVKAGVAPVVLGDNIAAQLHAESALENCFSSHWGIDGLKPYMRYSLAGGYQSNAENVFGLSYCIKASDGYRASSSIEEEIRVSMYGRHGSGGLMDSGGHHRNILDPWHRKLNVGLAWDRYNTMVVQHFEGDYVEYERLPTIQEGVLDLSGMVKGGMVFAEDDDLSLQIYYDPVPYTLTQGQVSRTYCYDFGKQIAAFRRPLGGDWYYPTDEYTSWEESCPDPYDVPANAAPPASPYEANLFWLEAQFPALPRIITVPWITAQSWKAEQTSFELKADIGDLLTQYSEGIYTVIVWGKIDGEDVIISEYSIFHGVMPPDTYD